MSSTLVALDLGASSGRVITARLRDNRLDLHEVARFPNAPVALPTADGPRLYWDILRLWEAVLDGLRLAGRQQGELAAVGVDSWAVDYGLLDDAGALLSNPASYRCARHLAAAERFFQWLPQEQLYQRCGLQAQPFNTIFQLVAEPPQRLAQASRLLLLPDVLNYWLSGTSVTEVTNASTTGLIDPLTRRWREDVIDTLSDGIDCRVRPLLGELVEPGTMLGEARLPELPGTQRTQVIAVGSHDTASAVLAVPAEEADFAYISCGTWSLVGLELDRPVLTSQARQANLTNELGVDGTVRFLKNVMGLWVLNEAVRTWREAGHHIEVADLVRSAAQETPLRTLINLVDQEFFLPGDMPGRIAQAARRTDQPVPDNPAQTTRCIIDSLALAYRCAVRQVSEVAGRDPSVVHMVGGGVQNHLLCQLTADATGLPVIAGPVEATALGNLAVQARAIGAIHGGLAQLRQVVRASSSVLHYAPSGKEQVWAEAEARLG